MLPDCAWAGGNSSEDSSPEVSTSSHNREEGERGSPSHQFPLASRRCGALTDVALIAGYRHVAIARSMVTSEARTAPIAVAEIALLWCDPLWTSTYGLREEAENELTTTVSPSPLCRGEGPPDTASSMRLVSQADPLPDTGTLLLINGGDPIQFLRTGLLQTTFWKVRQTALCTELWVFSVGLSQSSQ